MPDAIQTPLVDNLGNMAIHGRSGATLALKFQAADGTPRNVSAAALFFEVEGAFRVALAAGASNDERVLSLTRAQVLTIAGTPRRFALCDETATVPDVLWSGEIKLFGFTSQPA